MISLKRQEEIEVFQVELSLKVKTKQSPFIAVLILAQELGEVDSISLQANLFSTILPERACDNLLKRLSQQGYLQEIQHGSFSSYHLTELGEQCAVDKSLWIGEKGVYNVYVSKFNLIPQRIIRTEKVERAEDNRNTSILGTPREISQCENQIILINKSEVRIEDVEHRCFQLKHAICILEIQARENESTLKLSKENQLLYQTNLDFNEFFLQEELLSNNREFEYHSDKKAILTPFNKDSLSLKRKVKIAQPIFNQVQFNPVELENVYFIPKDKKNADLWYWELLYKNIDRYFLDENSFEDFANETAKQIQQFYKIKPPKRKELIKMFTEKEDAFYQTAKLETIDYLTY